MTRIAEYLEGYDFDQFKKDYKTVDAVIRNFEIIGEAAKKLPDYIKENNPDLPWNEMYLLKKECIHAIFIKIFYLSPSRLNRKLHIVCNELINIALGPKQYEHNVSTL